MNVKGDRWGRLQKLFDVAMPLPPAERQKYLEDECPDDPELRDEVASLIRSGEKAGSFIGRAINDVAGLPGAEDKAPGLKQVGPYRIERRLGHGGMGAVYLASRDDDEYRKQVAIKVVRGGLDSPEMLQRFRSERQILATLDHPNIARLLDGGTTDDGMPYVVMEYVQGEPIDAYCDGRRLDTDKRLNLFRDVCAAVQYAHRNLVVHRDIKPGNIMVSAEGVPKLLDFGIAKLLDPGGVSDAPALTGTAMRLLTPEYASPEQVKGETITTASDVYSLGVLLYELLTGQRPYRLTTRRPAEIEQVICEQEPETPSAAVTRPPAGDDQDAEKVTPDSIGRARSTRPERLRRRLSGDLDTIVLMALRKEPSRRYASVGQLSDDIRLHLDGLPVVARRNTWGYRTGKFIRRHRFGVAAASLFVVLLAGFGVTMALQAKHIAQQRDRLVVEQQKADRALGFMIDLFKVSDPGEARGNSITAREILDIGVEKISSGLNDQPEVRATLQETMGSVYGSLGLYAEAQPLLEQALETRRLALGEDHLDVAATLSELGKVQVEMGVYEEAEATLRAALAIREEALGPDHPDVALVLNSLGSALSRGGGYEEARPLFERALAIDEAAYGEEHQSVGRSLNNLAVVLRRMGDNDSARPLYERALRITEATRGPDHPDTAGALNNLATVLATSKLFEEARPLYERSLAIAEKVVGPEHPSLATTLSNLAWVMKETGDYAGAETLYRRALGIARAAYEPDHPEIGLTLHDLGNVSHLQGRIEESLTDLDLAVNILESSLGPEHPYLAFAHGTRGFARAEAGDFEGAQSSLAQSVAITEKHRGDADPNLGVRLAYQGLLARLSGETTSAEQLLDRSIELLTQGVGDDHPNTAWARLQLAIVYIDQERRDEATTLYHRVASILENDRSGMSPDLNCSLACFWAAMGKEEKALDLLAQVPERGNARHWIGIDPDLATLRSHPEFALTQIQTD